ncbi:hypothetical protein [Ktedonobacter racemifer]|uniref:Translation elongation factor P n=1 Tax=Ktedonobacter racemifer DSM 44963 TaxID=485913 RepID=D6U2I6_KTERA|nr:hypothetical protein [Ktedonobacter racemifer]EFH80950.1 translation elongation factor P [Ktedonobacter racemifer DSM 44963]
MVLDWRRLVRAQTEPKLWLKLRHLRTHAVIERTLEADTKLKLVPIERLPVVFMY